MGGELPGAFSFARASNRIARLRAGLKSRLKRGDKTMEFRL